MLDKNVLSILFIAFFLIFFIENHLVFSKFKVEKFNYYIEISDSKYLVITFHSSFEGKLRIYYKNSLFKEIRVIKGKNVIKLDLVNYFGKSFLENFVLDLEIEKFSRIVFRKRIIIRESIRYLGLDLSYYCRKNKEIYVFIDRLNLHFHVTNIIKYVFLRIYINNDYLGKFLVDSLKNFTSIDLAYRFLYNRSVSIKIEVLNANFNKILVIKDKKEIIC